MNRTFEEVASYFEQQNQNKCKVLSSKLEQKFNDIGTEVRVWNIKTDSDEGWWVVEGDTMPMNLYPQSAYFFTTDEVYSFHLGLMQRMSASYNPEDYVQGTTLGVELAPSLFRKLKKIAQEIDSVEDVEDFQSIGVQCRETLIELGNQIYETFMAGNDEQPQKSNFKRKSELFISFYLNGSENKDYRSIIRKLTESTWDYANKLTHSSNATFYEASTCVSLCISLVGVYENIRQKVFDPLSQYKCSTCGGKNLNIVDDEINEEGIVLKWFFECEDCSNITEIVFDSTSSDDPKYVKGKPKQ